MDEFYILVGFACFVATLVVGLIWRDVKRDKKFMKEILDHEEYRKSKERDSGR